uniref:Uncharacterized protein n=1 Tax=Equus caballus TaxID=9796 RepID=A0A9L0TLQ6_HORSE
PLGPGDPSTGQHFVPATQVPLALGNSSSCARVLPFPQASMDPCFPWLCVRITCSGEARVVPGSTHESEPETDGFSLHHGFKSRGEPSPGDFGELPPIPSLSAGPGR